MGKQKRNPFGDAFRGILATYRSERNLRIHAALASVAIILGIWLDLTREDWCWMVLCIALVVMAELFNTALEGCVDLISPSHHPLAGKAKDAAAAAVLVAAAFSAIIGGIIFIPRLWTILIG